MGVHAEGIDCSVPMLSLYWAVIRQFDESNPRRSSMTDLLMRLPLSVTSINWVSSPKCATKAAGSSRFWLRLSRTRPGVLSTTRAIDASLFRLRFSVLRCGSLANDLAYRSAPAQQQGDERRASDSVRDCASVTRSRAEAQACGRSASTLGGGTTEEKAAHDPTHPAGRAGCSPS